MRARTPVGAKPSAAGSRCPACPTSTTGDSFEVDWFSDILPGFKCRTTNALVINLDAHLYSSTVEVLEALDQCNTPGTVMYFDAYNDRDAEFRAARVDGAHEEERQGRWRWLEVA